MKNEEYQTKIERAAKNKRNKTGHLYFGDKVAKVLIKKTKHFLAGPVLDIGAGTGALIQELQNNGYQNIKGIDLYPKEDFINKGVITDLQFEDSSFKTVFCTEVIEHLTEEQIDMGLREVYRVLADNGFFVLSVPFNEVLEKNIYTCPHCGGQFHKVGHLQSFSKERLISLLKKYGFSIQKSGVYAFGVMSKIPFGAHLNWLFKKLKYEAISKSILVVCKKLH
jgi:ubiquinone/menaquinone biosynthesis C-methylase UbiE